MTKLKASKENEEWICIRHEIYSSMASPALTPKAECIIRKEKGNKGKAQGRTEEPDGYLGNIWRDCPSTVVVASSFLQNCLEDVASSAENYYNIGKTKEDGCSSHYYVV